MDFVNAPCQIGYKLMASFRQMVEILIDTYTFEFKKLKFK